MLNKFISHKLLYLFVLFFFTSHPSKSKILENSIGVNPKHFDENKNPRNSAFSSISTTYLMAAAIS
jgi:hypothetical protein